MVLQVCFFNKQELQTRNSTDFAFIPMKTYKYTKVNYIYGHCNNLTLFEIPRIYYKFNIIHLKLLGPTAYTHFAATLQIIQLH